MAAVSSGPAKPRILIVGAGFGGMATAVHLKKGIGAEVTLISHRNFHLFTPLLYQTATGLVDMDHLAQTVRPQARAHGFRFLEGDVTSVDLDARTVQTSFGALPYDYLVMAVGSVNNDFGVKGVAENTLSLKNINDGKLMHDKIVGALEMAAVEKDEMTRRAMLSFVVIGAGPTGVELAGSLRDFVRVTAKDYPEIAEKAKVSIVEALPTVLPGLSKYAVRKTVEVLKERGIDVRTSSKVVEVSRRGVLLQDGELIESANVFWTAGVKPAKVVESMSVEKERGRVKIDNFLRVGGRPEVFALGDITYLVDTKSGKRLAETAAVAVQQGRWLADALPELMAGKSVAPFAYRNRGFMLSIGRHSGVADFGWLKTSGFFGWMLWRIVHISLISTSRNRLGVAFDWTFAYFNARNVAHTEV
ncbi:MAG: NAD(P)/FAD-dependent oxidoreductase [Thaumarchaeota archaeon]|nr:NAD(P)/FAD-dependent oxidoreductase [Nitrososphaerota archaeon]